MNTPLTIVHVAGVALIVACVVLSYTLLAQEPTAQQILIAAATFLYGKMGFAPSKPIVQRIVQQLPQAEVERIQSLKPPTRQRPPQPPPAAGAG